MNTTPALFAAMILSACGGMTEEKYQEKLIDKTCDLYMSCEFEDTQMADTFSFDDKDECVAFMEAFVPLMESETCEFDSEKAEECVAAFNDLTCDDAESGEGGDCESPYSGECENDTTNQ